MNELKIVEYDEIAKQIDTVKESADFLPDVTTKEGYDKSKRISLDVGKLLTALEQTRKDKKAYFLQGGKEVDTQAKSIVAKLEAIQLPHKDAYKELDNLKKEREAKRKAELEERVLHIRNLPELLAESSSEEVGQAMIDMNQEECLDFYEYSEQALRARNDTRKSLALMFTKKNKEEKDAIELAKLKKEQVEREQKEREDRIANEAKKEAELKAAKAVKEKEEAKKAEEQAKQQAEEAEKARIKAEEESKLAAIEAEKLAKQQAEEAAEQARKDEVNRQRKYQETLDEEIAIREADKKHIGKIRGEVKEDFMALGLSEKKAKEVVLALSNGKIRWSSIQY